MSYRESVGLTLAAYRLPETRLHVEELEAQGKIASPARLLAEFGFRFCHVADPEASLEHSAVTSAREILTRGGLSADDLEALFFYSGVNAPCESRNRDGGPLASFRYPAGKVHFELGFGDLPLMGFAQRGCCGLLAMVDIGARLLASSAKSTILCLAQDRLPAGVRREIMYNVISDAAAAFLLERGGSRNQLVHFHQVIQTYYWDTPQREQELLAAYFPMAQRAIRECLERANLTVEKVAWFIPTNISMRSWEILADILSIPPSKIWAQNISRVGHTISCDHIINLVDMQKQGALSPGDYLALFTFGFGASWSCLIVRH